MIYFNLAFLVSAMVFMAAFNALNVPATNVAAVARSNRSQRIPS
jgi:hypothetical protein